ncbi:meiosis-specific protein ASY2-like [Eutrema salsugineum]|uniref:meiosis-specific protein ASY2-like n=1 Tax=Eutrema salsugineum TaxID=72664 RepID=UPI000CECF136|nr:meiosis-specific protein ASY2-like [Eutrema salsugineum]
MTAQRLEEFQLRYGFRGELMAPGPEDRPWYAPEGWVTLYKAWFSLCHLWVPLPRLLTDYVDRRGIAFSQILPAGIRFMVAALLFGSEAGVNVDWRFFEEMTNVQKNNSIPGTYTIKARKDCSLVYPVNRTPSWEASFFFAKVDETLVVDTSRNFRNEWSDSIDRNVQLGAFPENFHENIQKIRAIGIQHWPDIHRRRVEAAITRITNASWRRENQLRERAIAMSPIQVNAPSLAARLRANRSSGGNKSRESPAQSDRPTQATAPQIVNEVEARRDSDLVEDRAQTVEPEAGAQEEGQAVVEGPDETARRARKEAKKLKRKEKKKKDKDEVETTQLTGGANQPEVDESAAEEGSRKRTSGEVVTGGDREEPGKRSKVDLTGDGRAPEIDWSFKFDYPESGVPLVNNADKCAELFGLIKGSTSEVPAADDAVFKDMAGYAFKFIASCNRARGRYHRTIRAAATKLRNAQSAGQRAVEERDAAIARQKSAEEKWQVEKRRSEQLEEGVKTLTDKIEELKVENQDLISNLQTVNEAKLQAEKVVASEVARVKRHAEEKIESETTRIWADAENKFSGRIDRLRTFIAEQEAIVKVKLELVQARGTLECLDLLKDKEVELRADLEATMRDCELKLERLRLSDLQEGAMLPQYPETPDGGSNHDEAEDQGHREDEEDHEGGSQRDE